MRKPKTFLRPHDRKLVAQAQFRTGAGPMREKHLDPKRRRMRARREERQAAANPEE